MVRHLLVIHLGPFFQIGKQGNTSGMVHKTYNTLRLEISQNRHDNRLICIDSQISEAPTGTILSAKSNALTFLNAGIFKNYMEAGDGACHLSVCK